MVVVVDGDGGEADTQLWRRLRKEEAEGLRGRCQLVHGGGNYGGNHKLRI